MKCQHLQESHLHGATVPVYLHTVRVFALRHWRLAALDVVGTITADAHYQLVLQLNQAMLHDVSSC